MQLKVLGSSSKGNGYILDNGKAALLIEAGFPYRAVLSALNIDRGRIKGLLVTHEHGDHAGMIREYIRECIHCYMSLGTARALGIEDNPMVHILTSGRSVNVGEFVAMPFHTQPAYFQPHFSKVVAAHGSKFGGVNIGFIGIISIGCKGVLKLCVGAHIKRYTINGMKG